VDQFGSKGSRILTLEERGDNGEGRKSFQFFVGVLFKKYQYINQKETIL